MGISFAAPVYAEKLQVGLTVTPRIPGHRDSKVVTVPRPILSSVGLLTFGQHLVRELCPRTFKPRIDFHTKVAEGLTIDTATAAVLFPNWCFEQLHQRQPEHWTSTETMAMVIIGGLLTATPGWTEAINHGRVRAKLDLEDSSIASILLSFKRPLHPHRLLNFK